MKIPKLHSFLPPSIIELPSGRFIVPQWIKVDDTITFEEVQKQWVPYIPGGAVKKSEAKEFAIESSKGDTVYQVRIDENSKWSCSCVGFGYYKKCKHIEKAKEMI